MRQVTIRPSLAESASSRTLFPMSQKRTCLVKKADTVIAVDTDRLPKHHEIAFYLRAGPCGNPSRCSRA